MSKDEVVTISLFVIPPKVAAGGSAVEMATMCESDCSTVITATMSWIESGGDAAR